ncbi:cob(I)yrinic acid a,c-diamide adenosyltransferase [Novisyntrophococcus fermenticellae]|uniref:cob(I)yrinic acid a,c-diamide adenosyltransferase n=1 Tax=Novisyntrophococcus fermenticellae TaxID=2068655 RepID=UPI001E3D1630|nr:cob(I)yrinic acid a,c-diamide adenosyltransferase [Novisyntrophococcus fermenticellae]
MEKQTGFIHIYCGDGKGKTTCGMGLCTRAAGYGYKVLIYQFMKDNRTSERKVLEALDNVTFIDGLESEKFSFRLSSEEKAERKTYYESQFKDIIQLAESGCYDILFLDEILYAIGSKLFDETLLLDFLCRKPPHLEVILTGQNPSQALIDAADYVSFIQKVKHPFDKGIPARKGIER